MATAIDSHHEPESPDSNCRYPAMRFEQFRVRTLNRSVDIRRAGVLPDTLASEGYFLTQEEWIVCYDCGLHYGLGHHRECMADLCNIPVALTDTKMEEERNGVEAVTRAMQTGLLTLKPQLQVAGPTDPAAIQASCGQMDQSLVLTLNNTRTARRRNAVQEAGFNIVNRRSVGCPDCHAVIRLEKWTPLRDGNSLDYILRKHMEASPTCSARPLSN